MARIPYTCPFCDRDQMLSADDTRSTQLLLDVDNAEGNVFGLVWFKVCANPKCKKFSMQVALAGAKEEVKTVLARGGMSKGQPVPKYPYQKSWRLVPASQAIVLPEYVPKQLRDDYGEACAIRDSSPKAAATLARRCLQGMVRDFWGIKKKRLADAIRSLENRVDPLTWKAIDAIRKVGNIGAHMEKDVNLIVDVEPQEAQRLLALIEMLMREWYVARHEREKQLKAVVALAEHKESARRQRLPANPEQAGPQPSATATIDGGPATESSS